MKKRVVTTTPNNRGRGGKPELTRLSSRHVSVK